MVGISQQSNSSLSFIKSKAVQHRDKDGGGGGGGGSWRGRASRADELLYGSTVIQCEREQLIPALSGPTQSCQEKKDLRLVKRLIVLVSVQYINSSIKHLYRSSFVVMCITPLFQFISFSLVNYAW